VRELNWIHQAETWSLLAGVGKVFGSVTESRHLVDIINQTDLVEDIRTGSRSDFGSRSRSAALPQTQ
jgi:hypothetical protein